LLYPGSFDWRVLAMTTLPLADLLRVPQLNSKNRPQS
jgi:hypothetical protein